MPWTDSGGAGTGTFNFSGGTLKNAGTVSVPVNLQSGCTGAVFQQADFAGIVSGDVTGDGTLTKTGAEKLTLAGSNSYSGRTTVEQGALQFTGAAAWSPMPTGGGADIQAGKMIFDYNGESTPALTIEGLLTTSYNGGDWDTGQFLCSTADSVHGLGWADETVAERVVVQYPFYGDADLDGDVDLADLGAIGNNWGGTEKVWEQGDFDGDGDVDLADLGAIGDNWGAGAGGATMSLGAAKAAVGVVPEPSALALVLCGLAGLLAYARRRR